MGPVVSMETWDAWLDHLLPAFAPNKPAPRWMQEMAKRHAALASEVKALYDVDYYAAGAVDWTQVGGKR